MGPIWPHQRNAIDGGFVEQGRIGYGYWRMEPCKGSIVRIGTENGIPKGQHASPCVYAPLWATLGLTLCISIGAPKPASLNNVQLDVKRKGRSSVPAFASYVSYSMVSPAALAFTDTVDFSAGAFGVAYMP